MTALAKVGPQVWMIRGPGVLTGQGCFPKAPFLNLVLWLAGAPRKVGTLFLMLWASGSPQENPSCFSCGVTQALTL